MPNEITGDTPQETTDKPISLRITPAIRNKVDAAASSTGLKPADIMRLAMDRGVDVLLKQLDANPEEVI